MNALALPDIADLDTRRKARALYWQGWRVSSIARHLVLKPATIHSWKRRDEWDEFTPIERVEETLDQRLQALIVKDEKEGRDFKEIDLLTRQIERLARVRRYQEPGGNEADLNPKIGNRNAGPKAPRRKNHFSTDDIAALRANLEESLFDYQKAWLREKDQRTRMILKSRQIGATWYFAREALIDALETGRNQIFLSASKAQAHIFKLYIKSWAFEVCGIDLTGDPIVVQTDEHADATLYFLGSNARTAQGYHGNFYFDEFFWVHRFEELNKVASGMAMHKKWRKTYFSTPSSTSHEAYPFWTGSRFNRGLPKEQQLKIDVGHASLRAGVACEDSIWRHIVTILDAKAGGCDLFDIDELRREYAPDEFNNLLMCQFIDDGQSLFPLATMMRCMVDSWVEWAADFKPHTKRPFGNKPVWVGYDPASTGDSAGLVVIAPPARSGGKFRMLEKHQFRGLEYAEQAAKIEEITKRYNVTYIGIDVTGLGGAVYQLVKHFFPAATAIQYSVEIKALMVFKALDVIGKGRLEFDAGWTDVAASFMAIRKTLTASGRQATYTAGRSDDIGHADLAWAAMHVFYNEPLGGETPQSTGVMEIF
ncbi:terminase large subunit domain-containing protein [Perlucidibaca piscinae]|uniref:terminase large subunit domain-containing protein n=1 Tax=Perlucidibaca piscinae TaxID=392589 RepID=UPI0003B4A255|nr:terminase family protein [Perlucidibaca piscinae]